MGKALRAARSASSGGEGELRVLQDRKAACGWSDGVNVGEGLGKEARQQHRQVTQGSCYGLNACVPPKVLTPKVMVQTGGAFGGD